MSVTSTDGRDRGRPSSWSAAVDDLGAGTDDGPKRLFILAAGNTDSGQRRNYPDSNMSDSIHDPAQAWNALTVGGYTDKITIDGVKWPGWQPLAARGDPGARGWTARYGYQSHGLRFAVRNPLETVRLAKSFSARFRH
jgi:Subtilase family